MTVSFRCQADVRARDHQNTKKIFHFLRLDTGKKNEGTEWQFVFILFKGKGLDRTGIAQQDMCRRAVCFVVMRMDEVELSATGDELCHRIAIGCEQDILFAGIERNFVVEDF
jgi:hypothetical protein